MADRRRARHRRTDPGADPSEVVLRRLARARVPVEPGWVPSAPGDGWEQTAGWEPHATAERPDPDADPDLDLDAAEADVPDPRTPAAAAASRSPRPPAAWRAGVADRLPVTVRGAALAATGRALVGLGLLLAVGVALAAVLLWWSRPSGTAVPAVRREPPSGRVEVSGIRSAPVTSASSSPAGVVVHVTGAVRRPGLVELPGGSRVDDAVRAAGGATARADLSSVNLARPLVDGEQLVVLRRGQAAEPGAAAPAGPAGPGPAGGATPGTPLDLNTATVQQLDGLPGVGPVLAQRIVDWRTQHGRFTSVDELTEVSGIGERTLADLRPGVRV
ncbi:MAG: helix-hairpin-helix domain-containing protein [Actinomycetes bacterium]